MVGYTAAQNDHYLAEYSYQDGTLSTILEQQYEQYLVENITGGSSLDANIQLVYNNARLAAKTACELCSLS